MMPSIWTFTGKRVNPLDLREEDVCIEDIAHALALCNRFAGHTVRPISVAQHSVFVAEQTVSNALENRKIPSERQALLHDASEAYLGDVTKWLKGSPAMAGYREAEERAQTAIYRKFGLPIVMQPDVKDADKFMVRFEARMGFGPDFSFDHPDYPPITKDEMATVGGWAFWSWEEAEAEFLVYARLLGIM